MHLRYVKKCALFIKKQLRLDLISKAMLVTEKYDHFKCEGE
jgi:hypothetical protein